MVPYAPLWPQFLAIFEVGTEISATVKVWKGNRHG